MDGSLVVGVIVIGFVHGVLPDHGWPIAATYALGRPRRFLHGLVAGLVLGVGHLISSVALVLAYFWVSGFTAFAESRWMGYIAGTLLILLGIREYYHGSHGAVHDYHGSHDHHDGGHHHSDNHDGDHPPRTDSGHGLERELSDATNHVHHERVDHRHASDQHHDHVDREQGGHGHGDGAGVVTRIREVLPGGGGHAHLEEEHARQGLFTLGSTALLLGFAHEEPVQILAICVGTNFCLELMVVYSLAVIVAITIPTLALIAGYERHRETVERYTPYLPTITAIVLVVMGLGFVTGLL